MTSDRDTTDGEARAVEQFTLDGRAFAASALMNDREAIRCLLDLLEAEPSDRVLDLACGPGAVALAIAELGCAVTGVDLTPTMLELARSGAERRGVATGCRFELGRMSETGLAAGSFDRAVTRYALHHAEDPEAVAAELVHLVRPGGRIVAVDMLAPSDAVVARAYDETERRRDPSHIRNLTGDELQALFEDRGCTLVASAGYGLATSVETVLRGSHGPDHDGYRRRFAESTSNHGLGVGARADGADTTFAYPIGAFAFTTPGGD